MTFRMNAHLATTASAHLLRFLQTDPTPAATTEAVYGVITANGQSQMTATVFQLTTGDILQGMLLLVIAMLLLAILITLIWQRQHA